MKTLVVVLALASLTGFAAHDEGSYAKPNSQKGKIAFVDTQDALSRTNVDAVIRGILRTEELNVAYEKAAPTDCPATLKRNTGADFAIIILNDPKKPSSLVAVDDRWAMLNVAPLTSASSADAQYRKALMRIFSIAAGGWASSYPGNLSCVTSLSELGTVGEFVPADVEERNFKFLHAIGVTPREYMTYRQACREGWAPKPTNDVQRAIWKKVHELPTNPIRIKFDPKTDK